MIIPALVFAALSFTLSASAGLGGSLILVPAMSILVGPRQGVALAALLLASNNVAKVIVYRAVIPLRSALWVMLLTIAGAAIGASALVAAPESWVGAAIIASIISTFLFERVGLKNIQQSVAPLIAFFAGATSGFSGASGPLKGVALRSLSLDRRHFVGAASVVSLAGDATKAAVFSHALMFDRTSVEIWLFAIPLMALATLVGSRLNARIGERGYAVLFWAVMSGYVVRFLVT